MSIGRKISETIGYFADAMNIIFSPYQKHRSEHLIGVQPFTGEIYHES
jgi:hypothetical protein